VGLSGTVPGSANSYWIQKYFKWIQICPDFNRSKRCLPLLERFQIKYGWKELEIRNNFPYRNFSRFELTFELKIHGNFYELKSKENHWKILELWISMKFGQQAPCYTLLSKKMNFHQKSIRKLNSTQNGKFD
jgi:hypothetical protein